MKKLILAVALAATTLVGANAQGFVLGGGLAFEYSKSNDIGGAKGADAADYGFEIAPILGYAVNDKIIIGAQVGVTIGKSELGGTLNRYGFQSAEAASFALGSSKYLGWLVTPFFRYNFIKIGNVTIAGQANLDISGADYDDSDVSVLTAGLNIVPIINYAFNEHWSIESALGFASIGYNFSKVDLNLPGAEDPTNHNFGFGLNQGKTISVAAIYSF